MKECPRGVKREEFDSLLQLVNEAFPGRMGKSPTMADLYPLLYEDPDLENKRVIVEDGKVVSHVGFRVWDVLVHGCRVCIGSIGSVATKEHYRGRGYATSLLLDSFERIREKGACLAWISGGRGLYIRNQCVRVGCMPGSVVSSDKVHWQTTDYDIRPYRSEELDSYIEIYEREPLRYIRPRHDFARAVQIETAHPDPMWKQAACGVWHGGNLEGYAVIRRYHVGQMQHQVREYAGSRQGLVESIPALMSAAGVCHMKWLIQPDDLEFVNVLRAKGITCAKEPLPGTLRILDFGHLMDSLGALVERRASEAGVAGLSWKGENDRGGFTLGDEIFELSDARMAAEILFGNPEGCDPRISDAPGTLGKVLSHVLPVPFPLSGLNGI